MKTAAFATGVALLCLTGLSCTHHEDGTRGAPAAKTADREDVKSTPAPTGAIVLFDGTNLDRWVKADLAVVERKAEGKPADWKLADGGAVEVGTGNIMTRENFDGHFKLHAEFRVPYLPEKAPPYRGNSGVYLQGRYEVQVLDSYGVPYDKYGEHDCGSIYGIATAKANACKPPNVWQSYDIEFWSPRFEAGRKVELGRVTVVQNGVTIHERQALTKDNTTSGLGGDPATPGPIMLQDHGSPVRFRNIWIQVIKD